MTLPLIVMRSRGFGGTPTERTVGGKRHRWNWSGGYWEEVKTAQSGFEGIITDPVMFVAGEVGPERVTVEPTVGRRFDLIRKPLPPPSVAQLTNQIAKVLVGEA
jgi:hypothetical protein